MKVTIQMPEILVISACVYFLSNMQVLGWVHLGLGLFSGLARWSIAFQAKQQQVEKSTEAIQDVANSLLGALGANPGQRIN